MLGLAPVAVAATAAPAAAAMPTILPPPEIVTAPPFLEPPTATCVMGILDAKDIDEWSARRAVETLEAIRHGKLATCVAHDTVDVIRNLQPPTPIVVARERE